MPAKVVASKTRPTTASVSAFLKDVADPSQRADCLAMVELMVEATGEKPRMWGTSIVGFGEVFCPGSGGRLSHAPLLGFAPRKCALSVYLVDGVHQHDAQLAALGEHDMGTGCLYLWNLASVDLKVLRRILAASVKNSKRMFLNRLPA
ncbi:MAG: DUF1801 domain-containing protein [Vicinamibacteraceae bacterium]